MTRPPGPGPASSGTDGILTVDKPEGPTSHDVVACVRRAVRTRQVGHTGTLDPMATGVLVLVLGRATRLAQFLSASEKWYEARVRLGVATDSWDRTGRTLGDPVPPDRLPQPDVVLATTASFLGELEQTPPPFSAKMVGGVRAYALARRGEPVPVRPARVTLHQVEVVKIDGPLVDLRLRCSAGFYVRALADSLGRRLGCGASLESLRRTASGPFTLEHAVTLDALERALADGAVVPLDEALPDLPAAVLTREGANRARHGNDVGPGDWAAGGTPEGPTVRLTDLAGRLVAIARPAGPPGVLHPIVVLG